MAGIPEAVEAGRRFGIKIIPGIEISTLFGSRYRLFMNFDSLIRIIFTPLMIVSIRISELH